MFNVQILTAVPNGVQRGGRGGCHCRRVKNKIRKNVTVTPGCGLHPGYVRC